MTTDTDAAVIARVLDGDREAFGLLVDRYQGRVFAAALRLVRDPDLAQDVTQEVFLAAFHKLGRLKTPQAFGAWLARSTLNRGRDRLRQRRPVADLDATEWPTGTLLPAAAAAESPEATLLRAADRQRVRGALALLPNRLHRRLLALRYWEGLTAAEIGRRTGRAEGTVKAHLHRGLRSLRKLLTERNREP